jgi:hypothetical protein
VAVRRLAAGHESLALGVPAAEPGTVFVLAMTGGIQVRPRDGRSIVFGRNRDEVHVCVGADDRRISRRHGTLDRHDGHWWVSNLGRQPIRAPASRLLFTGEEPVPLADGYSPLFLRGAPGREHLLEVFVTGADGARPTAHHSDPTQPPRVWRLSNEERLALVVLGQRYLLHETRPAPLPWRQAADQLAQLQPDAGWTTKRLEHLVTAVRARLSSGGVIGLTRDEVGEPVGNALNDNLLRELLLSTTLVPPDLAALDVPDPPDAG